MERHILHYPISSEKWFKGALEHVGSPYKVQTTFFADLSIAECFGQNAVNDTYKSVLKEYGNNITYMTEFVLCLNHKIWQLYELDAPMAKLYDELWRKCIDFVTSHFKGKDLAYYYEITD